MAFLIAFSIEEKYMLSRLNSSIKLVSEYYESYHLDLIPSVVENLFLDLSRNYIKIIRGRIVFLRATPE